MRKIIFSGIILLLFLSNLEAQNDNSLLFRVTKNNLDTSYIYGTIHLAKEDLFFVNQQLIPVFNKKDTVYFEVLSNENEMQNLLLPYLMPTENNAVSYLDKEEKDLVSDFLIQNFGSDQFLQFNPLIPFFMVMQNAFDMDSVMPMDFFFMNMAKTKGKEMKQLETVEQQFKLITDVSEQKMVDEMVKMIMEEEEQKDLLKELMEAYRNQDLIKINKILDDGFSKDAFLSRDKILDDRNLAMVQKIKKSLNGKGALFFVGAGHLLGEKGLVNLLRQSGFEVSGVK